MQKAHGTQRVKQARLKRDSSFEIRDSEETASMDILFRFEELEVYQLSVTFAQKIFQETKSWPKEYLFGLTDQLRRASLSISLNIAEGYSRSTKDFIHFLTIARGSCFECVPIFHIAKTLDLITEPQEVKYYQELQRMAQMISKLSTALKLRLSSSRISKLKSPIS